MMTEYERGKKLTAGYPESEILFDLEMKLPKKVIDGITNAVEILLGNTERLETTERQGMYARRFRVRETTDGTVTTAEIMVAFVQNSDDCEHKGFFIKTHGECTDGTKVYRTDDYRWVGGLKDDGSISALVRLIEDYKPTDWLYARVEEFCEYLRDFLEELGEPVAISA